MCVHTRVHITVYTHSTCKCIPHTQKTSHRINAVLGTCTPTAVAGVTQGSTVRDNHTNPICTYAALPLYYSIHKPLE